MPGEPDDARFFRAEKARVRKSDAALEKRKKRRRAARRLQKERRVSGKVSGLGRENRSRQGEIFGQLSFDFYLRQPRPWISGSRHLRDRGSRKRSRVNRGEHHPVLPDGDGSFLPVEPRVR